MYEYINYVLANYLNTSVGHSEKEAISALQKDLNSNTEFSKGLRADLENALANAEYSWRIVFAEHGVFFTNSDEEACTYAKKIWFSLFEN